MASRQKVLKIKFDTHGRQDLISEQTYSIADILYMLKKGMGYCENIDIIKISLLDENGKVKASVKCKEM